MKNAIALMLLFWSSLAVAMYTERGATVDDYDPATGYYYKSWISDDRVTNIYVYDPKTHIGEMIFREGAVYRVSQFIYESGYDPKERTMKFGGDSLNGIRNNEYVAQRPPKDKLLIVTVDQKNSDALVLWTADKSGKNLKRLVAVDFRDDWHLDVRNSKIRIIKQDKNTFVMTGMDW